GVDRSPQRRQPLHAARGSSMSSWSIRRRVIAAFVVIVVLMGGMAVVAYARLARINEESGTVQSVSIPGLYASMALQDAWSDALFLSEHPAAQPDGNERHKTEARIHAGRADLDRLVAAYERTENENHQAFDAFKSARAAYTRVEDRLLESAAQPA